MGQHRCAGESATGGGRGYGALSRRRSAAAVLALAATWSGCAFDRERPGPSEPDTPASLSVEVTAPRDGATVPVGEPLTVRVEARDLSGSHLRGVGYVARRSGTGGNATLDSAAIQFESTNQASHEFSFAVPATLTTNTMLEIIGIAFGPGTQTRLSVPRTIVLARP